MLTARAEVENRVEGLDAGADDYVTKPFALEELLARLRALLRRTADGSGETLRFEDLELDPKTREVRRGGEPIELTRTEFSLLELFLLNPRQVLTRSLIFERVWGYDFGASSNSLDVYIGYLRRKTEAGGMAAADPDGARRRLRAARGMSFRARITIATAVAVAVAVAVASVVAYLAVRSQLRGQVDDALADRAEVVVADPHRRRADERGPVLPPHPRPASWAGPGGYVQVFGPQGAIRAPGDDLALPVDEQTREAAADGGSYYSDARVAGIHVRILTTPIDERLRRPDRPAAHRGGRPRSTGCGRSSSSSRSGASGSPRRSACSSRARRSRRCGA